MMVLILNFLFSVVELPGLSRIYQLVGNAEGPTTLPRLPKLDVCHTTVHQTDNQNVWKICLFADLEGGAISILPDFRT